MSRKKAKVIRKIYSILSLRFGSQNWWPAKSRFEVIVGAILTQNTNWGNVEKAIKNLRKNKSLKPDKLRRISTKELASLIKPAGYYNIKAKRLKNFINFFFKEYKCNINEMAREDWADLRTKLLTVNGIGPETADSILLYALDKPVFVVDAYTKRILFRHNLIVKDADYRTIQKVFTNYLKKDAKMFNEYHALLVKLGKDFCKTNPLCKDCPLDKISHSRQI